MRFALCDGRGGGGGGGGGSSDGGGGSGGVAGGRGISWDHPRLKNRTFLPFIEQAFRTYGWTYGQTDLWMDGQRLVTTTTANSTTTTNIATTNIATTTIA